MAAGIASVERDAARRLHERGGGQGHDLCLHQGQQRIDAQQLGASAAWQSAVGVFVKITSRFRSATTPQ